MHIMVYLLAILMALAEVVMALKSKLTIVSTKNNGAIKNKVVCGKRELQSLSLLRLYLQLQNCKENMGLQVYVK